MKTYNDLYTWVGCLPVEGHLGIVMEHSDGTVSLAIAWKGLATELKTDSEIEGMYKNYYYALNELLQDPRIQAENHWLRVFSDRLARQYWEYGEQHAVRGHEFGQFIRTAIADHLGEQGMDNAITLVLTLPASTTPFSRFRPKAQRAKMRKNAEALLKVAQNVAAALPGGRVMAYAEYEAFIWQCYHRDLARDEQLPKTNPRFQLRHRVARKPSFDQGNLILGSTYTKVALLIDYPDADMNWFYQLAMWFGVELHVTQILSPLDAGLEKQKSATQTERSAESASATGGEDIADKIEDHNDFRRFISKNNLSLFGNCYIVKMHHTDPDYLEERYREFKKVLRPDAVIHDNEEELIRLYWRVSQPGQGYGTRFLRPDHTWQVAHMAPVLRFASGDTEQPQMLRITSDAQLVSFSYRKNGTNHTITGAKSGSGKGVLVNAQVCELYPLGVNFYIAEVGPTYKWTVEAFGGTYFDLDPNKTVVSPFPDYDMAKPDTKYPLDADIVAPTIGALLPLLASPKERDIEHHISSIGELVLQLIYQFEKPEGKIKAPSLETFFNYSKDFLGEASGIQKEACQAIVNNLDSFLSSTAGSRFTGTDTLDFNSGIVGVNFQPLLGNQTLAKFLLVFISLRFKQLAFANSQPCRIVLDELHEFQRIDPYLIATLVKQLTRMGRKQAGAFHGVSQEPNDIAVDEGVLNQLTHRELLYLQDGHQSIAKSLKANAAVLERWQEFKDPEAVGHIMNYRQAIKMVGDDAFDLHLTFPQILLDLCNTTNDGLALKAQIETETRDPFERLKLFRERISQ